MSVLQCETNRFCLTFKTYIPPGNVSVRDFTPSPAIVVRDVSVSGALPQTRMGGHGPP